MKNQTKHIESSVTEERFGYKETKLGWIPEDWIFDKLSSVILLMRAGVSVNSEEHPKKINEFGVLKTSSVFEGVFLPHHNKVITSAKELLRAKLNPAQGELLISRMNTPDLVGACCVVRETRIDLFLPDRLWQTQLKNDEISGDWLNNLLNTDYYRFQIKNRATGTSNTMKNISKGSFLGIKIPIPSEKEQRAISNCLNKWDNSIQNLSTFITKKELQKKGLMQQLLTGKTRLIGFNGEWKEDKLGVYFSERKETGLDSLELLSIGEAGVYPQSNSNKKDTSNNNKSKYKRICIGDIGYNSMRMWQGRSALSSLEGIVSPAYTVVKPLKNADSVFFSYLFKLNEMIHKFYRNSQGMVSDTWICKFKDFKIVKFNAPPTKEEQTAIANVLQQADKEIALLNKKLDQLKDQKKGLMQQLLTGKKRLKF
jgi:type I restriction enzyme S subunit